jgi:hypothetical protein
VSSSRRVDKFAHAHGAAAAGLPPSWRKVVASPPARLHDMCNAANHSDDCDCGFGGDTGGGGGRRWGSVSNFALHYAPPSFGWSRDSDGTVASYINPNARCAVCACSVFFYRSPYNGRVYFDDLGWPWPKHSCTDNRQEPRRATRTSTVPKSLGDTRWHREGWSALLSHRVAHEGGRAAVRGGSLSGSSRNSCRCVAVPVATRR